MAINSQWIDEKEAKYRREAARVFGQNHLDEENRLLGRLPTDLHAGVYSMDDVAEIIGWVRRPSKPQFESQNDFNTVQKTIDGALDASSTEAKLKQLTNLQQVGTKMASAILLFAKPDRYTIFSKRSARSLISHGHLSDSVPDRPSASFVAEQIDLCHSLANQHDRELRKLDRALWVDGAP